MELNPLRWFGLEKKASAAGTVISAHHVGIPVWTPHDYEHFAKDGYLKNAIAYRCMAMKAEAAASLPYLLMSGRGDRRKSVDEHKMLDLLDRPNPVQTMQWMIESIVTYYDLAGQAYIESVGPSRRNAPPRELWVLRPDRMKVIPGTQGLPQAYEYTANGQSKRWDVDPVSAQSEILHIKRFNPANDWYGASLLEPGMYAIDRHNEADAHNMAVLQNGATPSGALMFKPVKVDGEDVVAPDELIDKAEKRLRDRYMGTKNSGRPFVFGGNAEWQAFGMNMEQLQLTESKLDAARDICAAFGVPIQLLLPGENTYSNKREAELQFYEGTVIPTAKHVLDHLNMWLAPRFGEDLELIIDRDAVEALSLRREIRQEKVMELYKANLIDRDEARVELDFEPQPEMPQHSVDGTVLTALVNAAQADQMLYEPLWRYLRSVGLIDKGQSFEEWVVGASAALDALTTDEAVAALTDQTGEADGDV